jgi:galactoside O-acetyltransferase
MTASIFSKVFAEALAYADMVFAWLPGVSGVVLRAFYLRRRLHSLGHSPSISTGFDVAGARNVCIGDVFLCGKNCTFNADGGGKIVIGNRVALNANVSINASIDGKVVIGDHVLVGPGVLMRTSNHVFSRTDVPITQQGHTPGNIKINDGVWVGGNVTILADVTIGEGAIVAAGAVVTRDVSPYAIVGGIPARLLKWRENRPALMSADAPSSE